MSLASYEGGREGGRKEQIRGREGRGEEGKSISAFKVSQKYYFVHT